MLWVLAGVVLLLVGGLGWLWWQRRPLQPQSLARRSPLPRLMNLRKSTLIVGAILVLLLSMGTVLVAQRMWGGFRKKPVAMEAPKSRASGAPASFLQRFPTEYPMVQHAEAKPEAQPEPSAAQPAEQKPSAQAAQPAGPPASQGKPDRGRLAPPQRPEPQKVVVQMTPGQPPTAQTPQAQRYPTAPKYTPPPAQTPPQSEDDWRWYSTRRKREGNVLKPPMDDEGPELRRPQEPGRQGEQGRRSGGSEVFPPAGWEVPADPYRVLYADQMVPVLLANSVNSDYPGTVRLKVTQDVMDRWGHGHVIVPRDTVFLAVQQGQPSFGASRLPLNVYLSVFPDGSSMYWGNGQVGDAMGANGLDSHVNNHYFKLLLGVGLQAILQIGVRAPFGSPGVGQYQQNLPQEFAQSAGQGVNQAGNTIIQRQFMVPPTLSQEFGHPATISFLTNVSFQTPPVVVRK